MNNEDAIKILNTLYSIDVYVNESLDLAIKALEERPQGDIHDFIAKADEGTLFQLKKEIENALTKIAEREAYEEARREAMRLDDNEDTAKWRGHA
ncbi:MAG: hypothetical protein IKE94_05640 [Aeriscardovia sp.]|nr:hypothetical protein [Aeriscardovia sp.]